MFQLTLSFTSHTLSDQCAQHVLKVVTLALIAEIAVIYLLTPLSPHVLGD